MAPTDDRSLAAVRLLAVLPPEVRHQLEALCRWRRFARGEEIIGYGDPPGDVFLITRGRVRVAIRTANGREVAFVDLGEGDHFGEIAAVDAGSRSAGVVALRPTTVACLSAPLFLDLCHRHPGLALAAMRNMARVIRQVVERVVELNTLSARGRVYAELLHLARAAAAHGEPVAIRPPPRHPEIAARAGTTRETVTRVLADLAERRLIERRGDALLVHDPDRLAALVDEARYG